MKIFGQLGLVFAFGLVGEIMARLVPIGIPASVWGLLFLLAALRLRIIRPEAIDSVGAFLAANMAFFFLPSAVSIINSYTVLHPVLFELLIVCTLSTALTFLVTYHTVRLVKKALRRDA